MRRIIIITLFIGCLLLTIVLIYTRWTSKNIDRNEYQRMMIIKQIYKGLERKINFYGRVIDQYNEPVDGAEVSAHIMHFSPKIEDLFGETKNIKTITDSSGNFVFTRQQGRSIYIDNIQKRGYEFELFKNNPDPCFEYSSDLDKPVFVPDPKFPVIFRLRKKQETTYLIHWENFNSKIFYGNATEEAWHLDLVWPAFRPAHLTNLNVNYGSKPMYTDVTVQVRSNQTQNGYSVCFAVPDISGGILETNVLMYTAPENGYQTNLVYCAPVINKEMFETNTFFYIKSRRGKVYARVNATFTSYGYDNGGVILDFQSWANPYGERNLEEEPRLRYETTERLHDEAEAALLQGKLPPKPNIQQLLKTEGEYKE